MDMACRDIQNVMDSKNSAVLEKIMFNVKMEENTREKFSDRLLNIPTSRKVPLKVNEFYMQMEAMDSNQVSNFLSSMDTKCLKSITIHVQGGSGDFPILDFSKIEHLEQWKNCEMLFLYGLYLDAPIQKLFHFATVYVAVKNVTVEMVLELKEAFSRFPHMKNFRLCSNDLNLEPQLIELFGQPYQNKIAFMKNWFFKVPNDSEKVITFELGSIYFGIVADLKKNVPSDALVL